MRIVSLLILLCLLFCESTAKKISTMEKVETFLVCNYKNICYYRFQCPYEDEKLFRFNRQFYDTLLYYTSHYCSSINYPFKELESVIGVVVTSPDSNVRVYCWDTWLGGTMAFYGCIVQYRKGKKIYSNSLNGTIENIGVDYKKNNEYCSRIYTLGKGESKTYLLLMNGIYSSHDVSKTVYAYTINDKEFTPTPIFKNRKGLQSSLCVYYNSFSVKDRSTRPIILFKFNPNDTTLFIPVVKNYDTVTTRYLRYQFNGQFFAYVKN